MVRCEQHPGACVLSIEGPFAADAAAALRRLVEQLTHNGNANLVLDLQQCRTIDSAALQTLLWLARSCQAGSSQLRLAGADANLCKVLEMTRLAHQFQMAPDVAIAMKSLQ